MEENANRASTSRTICQHPPVRVDNKEKADDFEKIWPETEKLVNDVDADLFRKFSFFICGSFTDGFMANHTPKTLYQNLRHFYDFFMEGFDTAEDPGTGEKRTRVKVDSASDKFLESGGSKVAVTGIMIHSIDSPFLFENLGGYLALSGMQILRGIHPVMTVKRENGKVLDILSPESSGTKDVFIKFYIKKVVNPETIKRLEDEISAIIRVLFLSVGDFKKMTGAAENLCKELDKDSVNPEDAAETSGFLRWLIPNYFIFMGMVRYDVNKEKEGYSLNAVDGSLFGGYRNVELMDSVFPGLNSEIEKRILGTFKRPFMMVMDFHTFSPSIIYHRDPVDVFFVRQFTKEGEPSSVTAFIGRFSRGGLMSRSSDIPFLRKKLQRLIESEKIIAKSHTYREIVTAFNQLPKRELFYIDRKTLSTLLNISASLQGDYELHLIVRHNPQFEYMTIIVIFSAKKYSQENLEKMEEYLCGITNYEKLYRQATQHASVATAFFYFRVPEGSKIEFNAEVAACKLRDVLMTWDELLTEKLVGMLEDKYGFGLYKRYNKKITDLYRQAVPPKEAVGDLLKLDELEKTHVLQLDITCKSSTTAHLRIYWDRELDLMKLIPTFKNLGLHVREEIALPFNTPKTEKLYIQLLLLEDTEERITLLEKNKDRLLEAIRLIISGETEDCELNRLMLSAGFDWRQVDLVRAYRNYMLQIDKSLNPASVTGTINKYTSLLKTLVDYFIEKFEPGKGDAEKMEAIRTEYEKGLGEITDLTEDSTMRLMFDVVENTLRTNYFKPLTHHYLSFKLHCAGIKRMPKPVPLAEIFVHSPYIDGLHLRGGRVARGGLRWSDRPDDFRTEILGLVKTQMVKNAVIVPAGSKGGFIIKRMKFGTLTDRAEIYKHHYQTFIMGLLDLTDNLVDGKPEPPKYITAYDQPDPYLVVAADKGTATMSDSANEISEKYGFWLKDAFASGGAIGYDHKKYGITARGAWECIKRHFRELGTDIQNESITVAGIGDMSGDVFGNGMLLSQKLKMVAAFNHMHIFLDPDPDPEKSFKERQRLFELGNKERCQWSDYSDKVISQGGGVFLRSAKSIPLSENMQKLLGVKKDSMSGQELIRTILTMPVDLLYCGGIGTYIRSSHETDLDVGDKANDSVRVSANKVRARVIGEGANLALTQKARVQYAGNGGISNTDAIDNAGGVNMSDHEVNIKIFLEILLARKELKNSKKRDEFFMNIGGEVAGMVLKDNYMQSSGISLDQRKSETRLELFCDYIATMESTGIFERLEEDIPNHEDLLEYVKQPGYLPRPILSVLYGYEKIRLNAEIINSKLVEYAFSERYFHGYFPSIIQRDYAAHLDEHRLKKEIIATVISNKIVNQAGVTFAYSIEKATGCAPEEICKAYLIVENLLQADEFRKMVYDLDNKIPAKEQNRLLSQIETLISRVVLWMLKHTETDRISFDFINQYSEIIKRFKENLYGKLESICSMKEGSISGKVQEMEKKNIPEKLAIWSVILPYLLDIMSIVRIKETRHTNFIDTGNLFIQVTNDLEIDWISCALEARLTETAWERSTVENLLTELEEHQYRIVSGILEFRRKGEDMNEAFRNYMLEKDAELKNYRETISRIKTEKSGDLLALGVLIRMLGEFD